MGSDVSLTLESTIKIDIYVIFFAFRSIFNVRHEYCNATRRALCQSQCTTEDQTQRPMCTPPEPGAGMSRQPDTSDDVQTGTVIR